MPGLGGATVPARRLGVVGRQPPVLDVEIADQCGGVRVAGQSGAAQPGFAEDEVLRGAQVRRFLILHKELDPDDEEITRTRKVRRGFIAQKYAALIDALYSGQDRVQVEAKVTYEDGRTGTMRAEVAIRDVGAPARAAG